MSTLYFTDEHEWLLVEGDVATVGITDHAQSQMGDVVFVELPDVGTEVAKGDESVVVESVKAASDVYAPASGEITEVNGSLGDDAEIINRSAEAEGWLYKMKLSDTSELDGLMDKAAYQAFIG